jgi:hypothetical protein
LKATDTPINSSPAIVAAVIVAAALRWG